MVKNKNGSKRVSKKDSRNRKVKEVREKAKAQAAKIAEENKDELPHVTDTAPFPTDNNGNSHSRSYLSVATKVADQTVIEKPKLTSFLLARGLLEKESAGNSDDDTIKPSKNHSIRVSVMCLVPVKDIEEEEAPFEAIRKMNQMVKCLINKIPSVKLGLWNPEPGDTNKFLKELPEDVDIVEKYAHDFNRFLSPGKKLYCQLNVFYNSSRTSIAEIESVISGFKKPRVQFMSLAHSDAISPIQMGTFTGSVKEMTVSPDFYNSLKKQFRLKNLGLWWAFPKSELTWTKDIKKWTMHYELERSDVEAGKNDKMLAYFNRNSSLVDDNFFGTQMSIAPMFSPFLDDESKMRCTKHAKKQMTLGGSLKSITLGGTQILNWADGQMENTLHKELMLVESIYEKTVIKSNGNTKFKGRLFYSIIPNQKNKMTTFHFSNANADEARSVARALPLFIRDYYKLEPTFFCDTNEVTSCLEGEWDYKTRTFLTFDEKEEKEKFDQLIDTVTAEKEVFISASHQIAMAAEGDEVESVTTRLTKGDVAPPTIKPSDDLSALTGETRESKAKAYAAVETKKVSLQYVDTINQLNGKHEAQVDDLQAQLDAALRTLKNSKGVDKLEVDSVSNAKSVDPDDNEKDECLNKEWKDSMSGLSLSSSDDEEPIIVGVRNRKKKKKEEQEKNKLNSPFRKKINDKSTFEFNLTSPQATNKKKKANEVTPIEDKRSSLRLTPPPLANGGKGKLL